MEARNALAAFAWAMGEAMGEATGGAIEKAGGTAVEWAGAGAGGGGAGASDAVDAVARLLPVLDALDPAAAARVRGGLPRCDSTFNLGLAFFLAATAHGVRDWLGGQTVDSVDALDGGALIDDLDDALRPRIAGTADGRTWRTRRVPVLAGGELRSLLYALVLPNGLQTEVTFALQIRLPGMGAVQLVATGHGRRMDVAVQTTGGLPAGLLADLHDSVAAAMADTGLTGALTVGPAVGAWLDLDDVLRADTTL